MFGYVVPFKDELKMREYNVFRGYYCGLCKTLGKEFGQAARMGLSYDTTFLGLFLSSMKAEKATMSAEGCITNPIKKKPVLKSNEELRYSAAINVMLVYFKLVDDWKDDRSVPALLALTAYVLPGKKAKKQYGEKFERIKYHLECLTKLEKRKCSIIDESAEPFALLMQEIFVPPFIQEEKEQRALGWLGYNLGRWIYILDAWHDIEKDIKQNHYNPVLLQYKYTEGEELEVFIARSKEAVEFSLTLTLDNIAKSFELLDIKHNKEILENIIYMGMRDKMQQIFEKSHGASLK